MPDDKFRSIPTVQTLHAAVNRVAARLVTLEDEFSGRNPDGQLAKIWESIEELNLRVLFLMNTLQITQTLSPIADQTGKVPQWKGSALEAYMTRGGREKLIAGIEAQEKAHAAALAAASEAESKGELKVEVYEGLPTEKQTAAAPADAGREGDATGGADDSAPTLIDNDSKTKH